MNKFDGETITEVVRPQIARMRYRVTKLPPYIIVHMQRFTKNNFFVEKNPTLGMYHVVSYYFGARDGTSLCHHKVGFSNYLLYLPFSATYLVFN